MSCQWVQIFVTFSISNILQWAMNTDIARIEVKGILGGNYTSPQVTKYEPTYLVSFVM